MSYGDLPCDYGVCGVVRSPPAETTPLYHTRPTNRIPETTETHESDRLYTV